jgi:hypothetical protein
MIRESVDGAIKRSHADQGVTLDEKNSASGQQRVEVGDEEKPRRPKQEESGPGGTQGSQRRQLIGSPIPCTDHVLLRESAAHAS